jgi:hypothetical protein
MKNSTAKFMQLFAVILSDHFHTALESVMLGYESAENVLFFVSGLTRHDESCCDLYTHATGHHASSSLSVHT